MFRPQDYQAQRSFTRPVQTGGPLGGSRVKSNSEVEQRVPTSTQSIQHRIIQQSVPQYQFSNPYPLNAGPPPVAQQQANVQRPPQVGSINTQAISHSQSESLISPKKFGESPYYKGVTQTDDYPQRQIDTGRQQPQAQRVPDVDWMKQCLLYEARVKELEEKIEHLLVEIERLSLFIQEKGTEVEQWKNLYQDLEQSKQSEDSGTASLTNKEREKYHYQMTILADQIKELSDALRLKNEEIENNKTRSVRALEVQSSDTGEVTKLKAIIEQKTQDFEQVRQILSQFQQQIQEYEQQQQSQSNQYQQLMGAYQDLQRQHGLNQDQSQALDMLKKQLKQKDEQLIQLQIKVDQTLSRTAEQGNSQILEMRRKYEDQQSINDQLRRQIDSLQNENEKIQRSMMIQQQNYELEIEKYDQSLNQSKKRSEYLEMQIQQTQTMSNETEILKNDLVMYQQKVQVLERASAEVNSLQIQNEQMIEDIRKLKQKCQQQEMVISQFKSQGDTINIEFNNLKNELSKWRSKCQMLEGSVNDAEKMKNEYIVLVQKVQTMERNSQNLNSIQQDYEVMAGELQMYKQKCASNESQFKQIREQNASLTKEHEQLRIEFQRIQQKNNLLTQQVNDTKDQLEQAYQELNQYQGRIGLYEQQIGSVKNKNNEELEYHREEAQKWQKKCQQLENKLYQASEQINFQSQVQIERSTSQLKMKEQELQEIKLKEIKWQVSLTSLQDQYEASKRQLSEATRKLEELIKENEFLKQKVNQLNQNIQNVSFSSQRSEQSTRDIEGYKNEILRLRKKIQMIEEENLLIPELKSQIFQQQLELASNGLRKKDQEIQELKLKFQSEHKLTDPLAEQFFEASARTMERKNDSLMQETAIFNKAQIQQEFLNDIPRATFGAEQSDGFRTQGAQDSQRQKQGFDLQWRDELGDDSYTFTRSRLEETDNQISFFKTNFITDSKEPNSYYNQL